MKKLIAAAVIVGATLALSGCTIGGDDRERPATSSPQATAPATAMPGPTAAPIAQASATPVPTPPTVHDSGWRFSTAGYGPIALGADATATLQDALFVKDATPQGQCIDLWRWSSGDNRTTHQQEWDLTVGQINGHVRYVYASSASDQPHPEKIAGEAATDTGLTFGSTVSDLRAAYPGIQKTKDTWDAKYGGYREWVTGGPDDDHDWLWSIRAITTYDDQPLC